jgi:hypothetical protein
MSTKKPILRVTAIDLWLPNGGMEIMCLPNFVSALPKLPEEPSLNMPPPARQKHKGLLDDGSVHNRPLRRNRSQRKTLKKYPRGLQASTISSTLGGHLPLTSKGKNDEGEQCP